MMPIPLDYFIIGVVCWWAGLLSAAVADYYEKKRKGALSYEFWK